MKKKGITDVLLVLILSGITVALIFVGIIYTYSALACYAGINISENRNIAAPFAGQLANAGVTITDVTTSFTDLDTCLSQCCSGCDNTDYNDCVDGANGCTPNHNQGLDLDQCISGCGNDNACIASCNYNHTQGLDLDYCIISKCCSKCETYGKCENGCTHNYNPGLKYVSYSFEVEYLGTTDSAVLLIVNETQAGSEIPHPIFTNVTPSKLSTSDRFVFTKTFPITPNCKANLSATASAADVQSGVPEGNWNTTNDYCISPPEKDVNVSVNYVTYNPSAGIETNVSITGKDVSEFCPQASAAFYVRRNNFFDAEALLKNNSDVCSFSIDTNTTRAEGNEWYTNPAYGGDVFNLRTKFNVTNDIGDITNDELVQVTLDFSGFTGDKSMLPTDCTKQLVVTKKNGISELHKNVTYAENSDGYCSKAIIWFNWQTGKTGQADEAWKNGDSKIFYVYSTNRSATIVPPDNLDNYYASFTWTDFEGTGWCCSPYTIATTGSVTLGKESCQP